MVKAVRRLEAVAMSVAHRRMPRWAENGRGRDVVKCLAHFGLLRGPRRHLDAAGPSAAHDNRAGRVRAALESLGPVFSAFGIYLSSRPDLLPANVCLELAATPDRGEVTPITAVKEVIQQETARSSEEAFLALEPTPFESRLIFQSHRAELRGGEVVTVRVVHPELEELLERDVELLLLLEDAFESEEWDHPPIESLLADFRDAIQQQMDCVQQAEALQLMAQDAKDLEILKVPTVRRDLSTSKMLTIEPLSGIDLENLIAYSDEPEPGIRVNSNLQSGRGGFDVDNSARHLCLVWLRQALLGHTFPVDPRLSNVAILPNKQVAFMGGGFESLPPTAKINLWGYLMATSVEDPDQACSCLLKEMRQEKRAGADALQNRFRQVVPFRDGGWNDHDNSCSIPERLFLHWRLVSASGYQPEPHLLSFYRGLFQVASVARWLAPGTDSFLKGLEDLRLVALLENLRDMMTLGQLRDSLGRYAAMMPELPKRFDEALTIAAEGSPRLKLRLTETDGEKQKNSSAVAAALLLVLAAIAAWSHALTATLPWSEKVVAIAFLFFGALLLRATNDWG